MIRIIRKVLLNHANCRWDNNIQERQLLLSYSDYERQWIWEHRDEVEDQLIEVDHNWKIHTGSYHGPRYRGFHPESGVSINDEQGLMDYAEASSEPGKEMETKYRLISSAGWRR